MSWVNLHKIVVIKTSSFLRVEFSAKLMEQIASRRTAISQQNILSLSSILHLSIKSDLWMKLDLIADTVYKVKTLTTCLQNQTRIQIVHKKNAILSLLFYCTLTFRDLRRSTREFKKLNSFILDSGSITSYISSRFSINTTDSITYILSDIR